LQAAGSQVKDRRQYPSVEARREQRGQKTGRSSDTAVVDAPVGNHNYKIARQIGTAYECGFGGTKRLDWDKYP
jgi:hypothetical protein